MLKKKKKKKKKDITFFKIIILRRFSNYRFKKINNKLYELIYIY